MEYMLVTLFKSNNSEIFFQNDIVYFRELTDRVTISANRISIAFSRSKAVDANELLFSQRSVFRNYLQKSLAYLLAATGSLPELDSIYLQTSTKKIHIDHAGFSKTWTNCSCLTLFSKDELNTIFEKNEKSMAIYAAITYWLKSQLVPFPNDQFRALWSGFNAVYSLIGKNHKREFEKLINFRNNHISSKDFSSTIKYIEENSNSHLNNLLWYQYVSEKGKKIDDLVRSYNDSNIQGQLIRYYRALNPNNELSEYCKQTAFLAKDTNYLEQLKFLLTEYAYYVRNKLFHAEYAYPLFEIQRENEISSIDFLVRVFSIAIPEMIKMVNRKLTIE